MTSLQVQQAINFVITWIVYASSYMLRKPLGVIKADLQTNYKFTKNQLGWLDTSFFLPYALVQIMIGNLGDKYGARQMIKINLLIVGVSMISFGFWDSSIIFAILLFFNGSGQATLWPNCVKSLGAWYSNEKLATIFGIWGTCIFAGGILGTGLAVRLQALYVPDLKMVFVVPSLIVLVVMVLVHFFMRTPEELGLIIEGKSAPTHVTEKATSEKSFFEVWRIKFVPELSFTMFGMKLVRYCLYMWLPMYLHQNLKYETSTAGYLSTAFEIGGVLGSASLGFFIDKFLGGRIHWGVCLALAGSALSLFAFQLTSLWGIGFNFFCLFMAGAFSSGPDSIVSGALASEVGEKENAQSAVSGVINGFGSLGTVVEGPIIAFVVTKFGWDGSFYAMIVITFISVFAIGRAAMEKDRQSSNNSTLNV